ncbi:MAG: response regulator [Gammaproteobacteria bacterium]|nr:MAG: response regulator [Gammaproteobacteria bacterium]
MAKAQILLADDDRVIRVTLAKSLRQYDFDVLGASSGNEAVEMGCEMKPDLVIMDFQMPDITGVEAALLLREKADVSCIFLSAYSDEEFVAKAAEAGALGYLVKPIDVQQVLPSIESALQRAAEIRELKQTESQLSTALQQGRETSIAIGILMARYNISSEQAFEMLRSESRNQRKKVGLIAAELVKSVDNVNRFTGDMFDRTNTKPN